MELRDALRTTGSHRHFTAESVSDETMVAILDDARFAPSGGNRQTWHVTMVKNPTVRETLRDLYLDGWHDYVAHGLAGLIPFSPTATPHERESVSAFREAAEALSRPDGFPEQLHLVPVLLAVTVDLSLLAAVDRDLDRYQLAGGASIYPFIWQILLAARDRGLGGVMTTVATRNEPAVAKVLHLPRDHAVAA